MAFALPDDLNLLLALEVLLSEQHVTRAARRLGITQSAMSQRLSRLRAHFDDALLVSAQRGSVLTPRGEALREPLARALAQLRNALTAGAPFAPERSERRFVLLGNDLFEAVGLSAIWQRIHDQAPGVRLISERVEGDFAQRLESGAADLAFVPDFLLPASFQKYALPQEPFVVMLRATHPRAAQPLTLDTYLQLDHLLIAPRGAPGSIIDTALASQGLERKVVARVQHFTSAPFVVAKSDLALTCPALVARFACEYLPVCVRTLPLDLPIDRSSMIWHERSRDDSGHRWLREVIQTGLRDGALVEDLERQPTASSAG